MNKHNLRIIKGALVITFIVGIFSSSSLISEKKVIVKNLNKAKNSIALTKVIEYETVKTENKNLEVGTVVTKEEGHNGLAYVDEKGNIIQMIESPKNAEIEIGTGEKTDYVGKLTGYGADCKGCSGYGTLACKTKEGLSHSLTKDGEYYNDNEYGKVRIIAAALEKFPCGTIIKIQNTNLGTFNAIVLDTGGDMRKAWRNGIVHIDLAFKTENDPAVNLATGTNIKYSVQRWGY
ncbi:MAG: hypothetical protein IKG27_01705 [Bacilli bacterium]|nr:hypothetical protein [Bacilli bacterium]